MEMVTAKELIEWEMELNKSGCRYVEDYSDPIMCDDVAIYNSVSVYGELPLEYAECMHDESWFGYDYLVDEFEEKYKEE